MLIRHRSEVFKNMLCQKAGLANNQALGVNTRGLAEQVGNRAATGSRSSVRSGPQTGWGPRRSCFPGSFLPREWGRRSPAVSRFLPRLPTAGPGSAPPQPSAKSRRNSARTCPRTGAARGRPFIPNAPRGFAVFPSGSLASSHPAESDLDAPAPIPPFSTARVLGAGKWVSVAARVPAASQRREHVGNGPRPLRLTQRGHGGRNGRIQRKPASLERPGVALRAGYLRKPVAGELEPRHQAGFPHSSAASGGCSSVARPQRDLLRDLPPHGWMHRPMSVKNWLWGRSPNAPRPWAVLAWVLRVGVLALRDKRVKRSPRSGIVNIFLQGTKPRLSIAPIYLPFMQVRSLRQWLALITHSAGTR